MNYKDASEILSLTGMSILEILGISFLVMFISALLISKKIDLVVNIKKKMSSLFGGGVIPKHDYKAIYEEDYEISKMLRRIMLDHGASRITIFELHNGSVNNANLSMNFLTARHEQISRGGVSRIDARQKIPAALYLPIVTSISRGQRFFVDDISDIRDESESLYQLFASQGVSSFYVFPICVGANFVPYMGVLEFENSPHVLPQESYDSLCSRFGGIGEKLELMARL